MFLRERERERENKDVLFVCHILIYLQPIRAHPFSLNYESIYSIQHKLQKFYNQHPNLSTNLIIFGQNNE